MVFDVLRYAGVAYLLWMAVATWRDEGLLNPKLTIFFFAFLPQFVPAGSGAVAPMLELSAVFMTMTFVVFAGYEVFASAFSRHLLTRPRLVTRVRRAFAASFLGLGAKLAVTAR